MTGPGPNTMSKSDIIRMSTIYLNFESLYTSKTNRPAVLYLWSDFRVFLVDDTQLTIDIYSSTDKVRYIKIYPDENIFYKIRNIKGGYWKVVFNSHSDDYLGSPIIETISNLPRRCSGILNVFNYGSDFNFKYLSHPDNYFYVHCDWENVLKKFPTEASPYFHKFFYGDSINNIPPVVVNENRLFFFEQKNDYIGVNSENILFREVEEIYNKRDEILGVLNMGTIKNIINFDGGD